MNVREGAVKKSVRVAFAAMGLGICASASAAFVSIEAGLVTRLRTYSSFGNGDVVIWVQNLPSGCDGFWLRTTEPNGKEMFAQLLAAQKARSPVYISGHSELVWPGSASVFCRIYSLDTYSD
jgi:hypothetical protein